MSMSETLVQRPKTFQERTYTFDSLDLQRGGKLSPVTIAYATWGKLNEAKDNAILIAPHLRRTLHCRELSLLSRRNLCT